MRFRSAWVVAVLAAAPAARAQELACTNTVNGQAYVEVSTFPVELHYELTVSNLQTAQALQVSSEADPLLVSTGFTAAQAAYSLAPASSQTEETVVRVESYDQCAALASKSGDTGTDPFIDDTLTVTWAGGLASCDAQVRCVRPVRPTSPNPSRGVEFWRTHPDLVGRCTEDGALFSLTSQEALGLLWDSPRVYTDDTPRSELDRDYFLAAREFVAAQCNRREIDTTPNPSTLLTDAAKVLNGLDGPSDGRCDDLVQLADELSAFNQSGVALPLPERLVPTAGNPASARQLAKDPTTPTNFTCAR